MAFANGFSREFFRMIAHHLIITVWVGAQQPLVPAAPDDVITPDQFGPIGLMVSVDHHTLHYGSFKLCIPPRLLQCH